MNRVSPPRGLTGEQLRRLVVDQRTANRQARLEHFRKTGRIDTPPEHAPVVEAALPQEIPHSLPRAKKRSVFDILLLLVEIAAVAGLVYILVSGVSVLQDLNRQVLQVIEQPTLTVTPLISAVVLPSGHTPPDESGVTRPNEAEIPQHLQPLVQSLTSLPVPTLGASQAVRIQLPSLGVDAPIVQGDGWEQLKKGVGQHPGTADPGSTGNVVLSAHNDIFGEIFRDLERLKPGDEVILFTSQRTFTYIVTTTKITEPTDVEVMKPTGSPIVTLISWFPYRVDDKRIVVTARLQKEK